MAELSLHSSDRSDDGVLTAMSAPLRCAQDSSGPNPMTECLRKAPVSGNVHNAIATPLMLQAGVPVVPLWEAMRTLGFLHTVETLEANSRIDCLHWKHPSDALVHMVNAVVSVIAEQLSGSGSGTVELGGTVKRS